MDERTPSLFARSTQPATTAEGALHTDAVTPAAEEAILARGSGRISEPPPMPPERRERTEHSIMEGLPEAKAERIAAMRRELADLQRQLIDAQQRIATELQGRADDAERFEILEARLQAQELKAQEDAARAVELELETKGLRSQVTSAGAIAETLHGEVAARDAQLEEVRRLHRDVTEQHEAQSSSLRDASTLLETRTAELATTTTERDTERATSARLERELADQRTQHLELTEQLERQFTSLRDAKALIETRDVALATITSERDARAGELEQARRELEATRGKAKEIATQLVRFGQELSEGISASVSAAPTEAVSEPKPTVEPAHAERQAQPPLPSPRGHTSSAPVDTILGVTTEPKAAASRIGSGLLTLGGVIVGCVVTYALMNRSSAAGSGDDQDHGAQRSSAAAAPIEPEPAAQPASTTLPAAGLVLSFEPAPAGPTNESTPPSTVPAEIATEGVLVLSPAAARHRLYVDGKVVEVQRSRAVVPCGTHEVRVGSRGTAQTLEVGCGGEITLP